ncbi:MAG: hypothetical protein A4E71_02465 [Smithella sp. PtaU1.Bin162]|nr:MAG: hypothetical protein A4E71_02465 [Smithella sp. PtaU1.Bin162]
MIILLFSPIGANTADTRLGKSFFHLWFSESYNAKNYLFLHYSFMSEVANLFFQTSFAFLQRFFLTNLHRLTLIVPGSGYPGTVSL